MKTLLTIAGYIHNGLHLENLLLTYLKINTGMTWRAARGDDPVVQEYFAERARPTSLIVLAQAEDWDNFEDTSVACLQTVRGLAQLGGLEYGVSLAALVPKKGS